MRSPRHASRRAHTIALLGEGFKKAPGVNANLVGAPIDVDTCHVDNLLSVVEAVSPPQLIIVVETRLELDAVKVHALDRTVTRLGCG